MKHLLTGSYLLLIVLSVAAQRKVVLKYKGCGFNTDDMPAEITVDNPSNEALEYVKRICQVSAIDNSFWVEEGDVPTAMSTTDDQKHRVIYYSKHFFSGLNSETYKIAILAHEIGHHLNFNIFSGSARSRADELNADRFAGSVLCRLGLKIEDATQLLNAQCPIAAKGFYPARSERLQAFSAGFGECSNNNGGVDNAAYADKIKSMLYKIRFNSTLSDVLAYEWGPEHANAFPFESLPTASECTGQVVKYNYRPLKDSKLAPEVYNFLSAYGLRDQLRDETFVVYVFKDNRLVRISLRIYATSAGFERSFFTALGQNTNGYRMRYQAVVNGLHFISGSSFNESNATEIYIMNEAGYNFCIHDWWYF